MIYLQLFISFFKIGLFGFGGGYAILSLIQHEIETYGWMTPQEFTDIVAISQMTPGPIGINSATYVGYTAGGGILGAVVATTAIILPSVLIMLAVCRIYLKLKNNPWVEGGLSTLRITVLGLIAAAALLLMTPENFIDGWSVLLFLMIFCGTLFFKAHPILLIILAGAAGYLIYGPAELDRYIQFKSAEERHYEAQADSVLNTLSTREQVAQLFMESANSYLSAERDSEINHWVGEDHIGGIILMHDSLTRSRAYINRLQHMAKTPLLVAIDGEWGPAMRYREFPCFPRQMQLGALPDDSLVYEMGRAVGRQCRIAGIHINFAPVVDINVNPENLVIDSRSFGSDPRQVARYASAYMRGMQAEGTLACAKHFPGHGDTNVDSHRALPTLPFTRERLDSVELYPFRRLIADGVEMVMLGHLMVPALDTMVSSISKPIITGLLKRELNFNGLVVTDALSMKGVSEGRTPPEVARLTYEAGTDILLMTHDAGECIDSLTTAIERGELSKRDLRKRARKVLLKKAQLGFFDSTERLLIDTTELVTRINAEADRSLITAICCASIHRQEGGAPLAATQGRIAYLGYNTMWEEQHPLYGELEGLSGNGARTGILPDNTTIAYHRLQERLPEANIDYFSLPAQATEKEMARLLDRLASYDNVVLALHDNTGKPQRVMIHNDAHAALLAQWAEKHPFKLLYFGNPYGLSQYPWVNKATAIVVAYSDSPDNERAAAEALINE